MRWRAIGTLGAWVTIAGPLAAQTLAPQSGDSAEIVRQVREATAALERALAGADSAALASLYADGYVHIDQFGARTGKAERLAEFARGTRRVQAPGVADSSHYALFGETVVATGRTDGQQSVNGAALRRGPRMSTRVWMRRNGQWQVILAQTTPIAPQ